MTERVDRNLPEDFNTTLRESANALGIVNTNNITNEKLTTIRNDLDHLLSKWSLLPTENTLSLHFNET